MPKAANDRLPHVADPGIRAFLAETEQFYPDDAVDFSVAEQRDFYERLCAHFRKGRPAQVSTEDMMIEGVGGPLAVRVYRPGPTRGVPTMLYLHGGGFVVGNLESHDDVCAELAARADIGVMAVAYRLAPEHRFPAAFEDAVVALDFLTAHAGQMGFDADRIIVGGDSAGGNLAAAVAISYRDDCKPAPRGQVLIYPGLGGDMDRGSYVTMANAPGLTTADVRYYKHVYIGPDDDPGHGDKFARPLRETDYANLPPAFLVACALDPLHDDAVDYARHMEAAGSAARVRHEPLLPHAFLRARHMSEPAAASFTAIVEAARSLAHDGRLPETI